MAKKLETPPQKAYKQIFIRKIWIKSRKKKFLLVMIVTVLSLVLIEDVNIFYYYCSSFIVL